MFWICMVMVAAIIAIEHLQRRRNRRLDDERVQRWLDFQAEQERKYGA